MPTPPLLHSQAAGVHPAAYLEPAGPTTPKDGHLRVDTSTTPWQLQCYRESDATWHNVGLVSPVPPGGGGALTLLWSSVLASPAASITTAALPATASHLWVVALLAGSTSAQDVNLRLRFNGDTGANYGRQQQFSGGGSTSAQALGTQTSALIGAVSDSTAAAHAAGQVDLLIPGYAGTTFLKAGRARVNLRDAGTSVGHSDEAFFWDSTAAISTLTLFPESGNWVAGSGVWVYGLA